MSKAERLRTELAIAEAEEELRAAKSERTRCEKCGRLNPDTPRQSKKIAANKANLARVRRPYREAREAARRG